MHVQLRHLSLDRPGLGEVHEARADPEPAEVGMDAGFVLNVRRAASLGVGARVSHNLPVDEGEQEVGFQPLRPAGPPPPELFAAEAHRRALLEIRAVAGTDERGDSRRVVQGRWAKSYVRQSGWPDSNRRLLRPKRSTLTRLSYTPQVPPSVVG